MNKKLLKLQIIGFVFVSVLGTLNHFVFKWSGNNKIIALFVPINESPWEHMKMLFFPFLIFTIFSAIKLRNDKFNIFSAGYISVDAGMISTLCYFYTLNGIIGGNNEWVNLSSFYIGALIIFVINYFLINNSIGNGIPNGICKGLFIVKTIIFAVFTFVPPLIPLFQDPLNLTFGI